MQKQNAMRKNESEQEALTQLLRLAFVQVLVLLDCELLEEITKRSTT